MQTREQIKTELQQSQAAQKEVITKPTKKSLESLKSQQLYSEIKAEALKDVVDMRYRWSDWILKIIIIVTFFDIFIVLMIGFRLMKFDAGYIVPIIIGESLIKIIGLALVVVKFLFDEKSMK